ncbi:putative hypothetical protein [Streptomyces sp. NBRC 110611]|uniref:DUF6571 family protein n=1 Tax=Streptomyces sp. NBRC 110611 TaxID=1621259 RepID=UPI0008376CA1|nr:DUF6571 family protein [Streptomyces sp. NBRC 110611]GAU71097.1 putative hypothetical protein [Streptomyces sp. NBRC 110611]
MPTYEQLYNLDHAKLAEAAEAWGEMARRFTSLTHEMSDRVEQPFRQAGWQSSDGAAASAGDMVKATAQEISDASTEARAIRTALAEAHAGLKKCQEKLHKLANEEAKKQKLHVSGTGEVTDTDDSDPELFENRQLKVQLFAALIVAVLNEADEIDASATRALRRDVGNNKSDFNSNVATSLASADADYAAELMKKGSKMSNAELTELDRILSHHRNDPAFSAAFYNKLGPKQALKLYGDVSLDTDADATRKELIQDLQRNMGENLATATDPDNKPHLSDRWSAELRKVGAERIHLDRNVTLNMFQPGKEGVYGYQLIGGLLRYGNYDSRFLTPIAEHVTQLNQKHPDMFRYASLAIDRPDFDPSHRRGGDNDPLIGVMEALGHSPEAATDFFTGPMHEYNDDGTLKGPLGKIGNSSGYLDFLTHKDPSEIPGMNTNRDSSPDSFPESLGHALEAATTGHPYDDADAPPVKHSPEQAKLVEQVVDRFGEKDGPGLLNGHDKAPYKAIRGSLGHITAEYMGDFQRTLSAQGDLPSFGARADLDADASRTFLGQVGQDPEGYASISASQQAYTTIQVDRAMNAHTDSTVTMEGRVANAVHPGATIAGIMSQARAEAVHDTHTADDKDFNDRVDAVNRAVSKGLLIGTGSLPGNVIGNVVGWGVGEIQQQVVDNIKQDTTTDAQYDAGKAYSGGITAAQDSARAAVDRAARHGHFSASTLNDLKNSAAGSATNGHTAGAQWEDARHG